jgi:hypothetical protein
VQYTGGVNSGVEGAAVLFLVAFAYTVDVIVVVFGRMSHTVKGSPGASVTHGRVVGVALCAVVYVKIDVVLKLPVVLVEFPVHEV